MRDDMSQLGFNLRSFFITRDHPQSRENGVISKICKIYISFRIRLSLPLGIAPLLEFAVPGKIRFGENNKVLLRIEK